MAQSIGQIIRGARENKNFTREQLAKKLKISASYLAAVECDHESRHISERLIGALRKHLGARMSGTAKMIESHNRRVRAWYRAYNKKAKKH